MTKPDPLTALRAACAAVGIPAPTIETINLGENSVYRLPGAVVARVSRSGQLSAARREVLVTRWLAANDVPAVRAIDLEQPVDIEGLAVTFWHELPEHRPGTPDEIAGALRRLHDLPIPRTVPLGALSPFVRIAQRIEDATVLADDDRAWLRQRLDDLEDRWDTLPPSRPHCVVHGDIWAGNALATVDGAIVLVDLERCSVGPPEWDLTSIALKLTSFAFITDSEYRAFCERYGYDVTTWEGFELLRDIRELRMCSYVAQLAGQRPGGHREALYRVRCLRGDEGPRPWSWTPF